ncbi:hypothetical protein MMC29_005816 [Sticta canariensis]|nr:hypothetical protein [Sticta canariensis]
MTGLSFEVDPPSPNSKFARFHVIEYIRLPAMLKLFEETAGFSLGSLAQRDKFLPEPMPLESHKTVIDYAKFMKDTWGKSTIMIRMPMPKTLSAMFRDLQTVKLQLADLEQKMDESIARDEYQLNEYQLRTFRICRGNLLIDLIKKLLPEEAKKSGPRPTSTRWSTMAENYAEADFKQATQNFDFTVERNEATHDRVDMARLLTSSTFREKPNNRFWCRLFEYVYEQTVEEAV